MFTRSIPAVTPDGLKFAASVCMAAASQKGPYPNPAGFGINLFNDDNGQVVRLSPTDNPLSRGALAVCRQFGGGEKSAALMMRISGFMRLLEDKRMKPFIRGDGSPIDIRQEVLEVPAVQKMSAKTGFNAKEFFRKVHAKVAAHDREHGEPVS